MGPILVAALGLGIAIVFVRRRSVAIVLVAAQTLLVTASALALAPSRSPAFAIAALVLAVKSVLLTVLLGIAVARSREQRPVSAPLGPLLRLVLTVLLVLAVNVLVPALPGLDAAVQRSSLGLVFAGAAIVVLRRATILQLIGLLVAENGVALAAVTLPGGMPVVIELGALLDLVVVISVALVFHDRIFRLHGSGDSAVLRELHD